MLTINFAHSGRTDTNGGHKDKSGLGPNHYHHGGYSANLHDGGVCLYTGSGFTTLTTKTTSFTPYCSKTRYNQNDL